MDYSVQGYLRRKSTEELAAALHYYLDQKDLWNYENVIRLILDEIYRREQNIPVEISPELKRAWEIFKERYYSRRKDEE